MPPPTAASNRSAAPVRRAIASSSGPWWARTCLFAVTTGLPAESAAAMSVRAGSSPPISSTTTSVSGAATRCAGASVSSDFGDPARHRPGDVPDGDAGELERRAVRRHAEIPVAREGRGSPRGPRSRRRARRRAAARSWLSGPAGMRHRANGSGERDSTTEALRPGEDNDGRCGRLRWAGPTGPTGPFVPFRTPARSASTSVVSNSELPTQDWTLADLPIGASASIVALDPSQGPLLAGARAFSRASSSKLRPTRPSVGLGSSAWVSRGSRSPASLPAPFTSGRSRRTRRRGPGERFGHERAGLPSAARRGARNGRRRGRDQPGPDRCLHRPPECRQVDVPSPVPAAGTRRPANVPGTTVGVASASRANRGPRSRPRRPARRAVTDGSERGPPGILAAARGEPAPDRRPWSWSMPATWPATCPLALACRDLGIPSSSPRTSPMRRRRAASRSTSAASRSCSPRRSTGPSDDGHRRPRRGWRGDPPGERSTTASERRRGAGPVPATPVRRRSFAVSTDLASRLASGDAPAGVPPWARSRRSAGGSSAIGAATITLPRSLEPERWAVAERWAAEVEHRPRGPSAALGPDRASASRHRGPACRSSRS